MGARVFLFIFILMSATSVQAKLEAPCAPFRVHLHVNLPKPPEIPTPASLPDQWEDSLLDSISKIPSQQTFPKIYKKWLKESHSVPADKERYRWLQCILYYTEAGEWTAIVDNRPSRILYPTTDKDLVFSGTIPKYLRISPQKRPTAALYQEKLFEEFGILAIDHTDRHSGAVLKELYFLLENIGSKKWVYQLKSLKYVYAFTGHDSRHNVAAYHHQMKAISIGGVSSYPHALTTFERIHLVAALAHEMGHAFLFDRLSPSELRQIAETFGGWNEVFKNENVDSFYSRSFFRPYPEGTAQKKNFTTQYASKNVHEWFADAFAGQILRRLGKLNRFGRKWKTLLGLPQFPQGYWINYNNLSPGFANWFNKKSPPLGRGGLL